MNTSTIGSQHSLFPRVGIPINQVNDTALSRPLQINDKHCLNNHYTFTRIPKRTRLYLNCPLEQKSVVKKLNRKFFGPLRKLLYPWYYSTINRSFRAKDKPQDGRLIEQWYISIRKKIDRLHIMRNQYLI